MIVVTFISSGLHEGERQSGVPSYSDTRMWYYTDRNGSTTWRLSGKAPLVLTSWKTTLPFVLPSSWRAALYAILITKLRWWIISVLEEDLGSISSEIKSLQEQSMSMGLKLKNRRVWLFPPSWSLLDLDILLITTINTEGQRLRPVSLLYVDFLAANYAYFCSAVPFQLIISLGETTVVCPIKYPVYYRSHN